MGQNHKKNWVQEGIEPPPPPPPLHQEAFKIKGAWWNAEQNKNTNSNNNS